MTIEAVDLANKHLDAGIDYSIVGVPAILRGLVEQGYSDNAIGQMANCAGRTVVRWRLLFGIKRAPVPPPRKPKPKLRLCDWLTRELFREVTARAYARHGRRWPAGYDPKEDASADPWWDG